METELDIPECPLCGDEGDLLGVLGRRQHFRCRQCGIDFSHELIEEGPDG